MGLKTDRRTQLRKRPLSLVYVELPPSNGGMMRDLSEYGFSLRAMMPLRQSEKLPFSFVLEASARIDGEAIVARTDDGGRVATLEFAGLPAHSRDQIHRWLDKHDEPLSPEAEPTQPMASEHSSLTELRAQIRAPKPPLPEHPAAGAEDASPTAPPKAPALPRTEPPPASLPSAVENGSLPAPKVARWPVPGPHLSPVAESPLSPPLQTAITTPDSVLAPSDETPVPLPRAQESTEAPSLPPLLKLSSVRPGPPATEVSEGPQVPVSIPKPIPETPAAIQISLPKLETPVAAEKQIPERLPAPPVAPRRVPPALEPLSAFEGETDSESPGWLAGFTLVRAIGIMLFLALLAGSYVYHREFGQALIWLGHEIAGQDSPESSKVAPPGSPSVASSIPEPSPPARSVPSVPPSVEPAPASTEPEGTNLPSASEKTPIPQLKEETPGELVPLTQVTRSPAPASPADKSVDTGQREYLQALQILRSPSRTAEIKEAVRLLWVAVEKGNTGAEIDLAELFRKGQGVAKNCDQTRILLSAAARKGSAEARKRLEAFQREGCSN
jgi:PilZ domain